MDTTGILLVVINLAWLIPFIVIMARKGQQQAKSRAHRERLLTMGLPAAAVVVQVDEVGPYYRRVPHLAFVLRVEPESGAPFEASARGFFRHLDYPRLQPGMRVEVRFDPADPKAVAVVGDTLGR